MACVLSTIHYGCSSNFCTNFSYATCIVGYWSWQQDLTMCPLSHNWVTFQMKLVGGTKLSATTLLDTLNLVLNIEIALHNVHSSSRYVHSMIVTVEVAITKSFLALIIWNNKSKSNTHTQKQSLAYKGAFVYFKKTFMTLSINYHQLMWWDRYNI